MGKFKVLVCGGRNFLDDIRADKVLDGLHEKYKIDEIIEGGAKGADTLGREWAVARGVPVVTVKADWDTYGKRAGYLRNVAMADLGPELVVSFPGGVGTDMMGKIARQRKIEVIYG